MYFWLNSSYPFPPLRSAPENKFSKHYTAPRPPIFPPLIDLSSNFFSYTSCALRIHNIYSVSHPIPSNKRKVESRNQYSSLFFQFILIGNRFTSLPAEWIALFRGAIHAVSLHHLRNRRQTLHSTKSPNSIFPH